ncbi:MAG: response regulator [Acidobacteria bacterium]|nr:response regulator [Acidobacteriota bacterium]
MAEKPYYTTFKISQMCGVNPTTVQNWVKGKKLRAFQTPGGHRRIQREDLIAFLKKFGMPIPAELAEDPPLVLIVDDEADILDMIEDLVRSGDADVEVAKAQSGVEALLMIGERKPELLILDLKMPGMNGYEVCRKLKSSPGTQNIRIVAISGDHDTTVKERILETGADLFFTKPIDVVEFRAQCFKLLQI